MRNVAPLSLLTPLSAGERPDEGLDVSCVLAVECFFSHHRISEGAVDVVAHRQRVSQMLAEIRRQIDDVPVLQGPPPCRHRTLTPPICEIVACKIAGLGCSVNFLVLATV